MISVLGSMAPTLYT